MTNYTPKSQQNKAKSNQIQNKASVVKPSKVVKSKINDIRKKLITLQSKDETNTIIDAQFVYGYTEVDTDVVFREIDAQGRLHTVNVIAHHLITEIKAYVVDGVVIYPDLQLLPNGFLKSGAAGGTFAGLIRFRERRGFAAPAPISELVAETSATADFIGSHCAYVYVTYIFNKDKFVNGDPTLKVVLRGKECLDPRTPGVDKWSIIPQTHIFDMLRSKQINGGGELRSDELQTQDYIDAINFAEGTVNVTGFSVPTFGSASSVNVIQFSTPVVPFNYGDVVRVSGANRPSALQLNTDYHVIVHKHILNDLAFPEIKLASSFANAMANIPIITGTADQDFLVTKVREIRFAAGGAYRDKLDSSVLEEWFKAAGSFPTSREGRLSIVSPTFPSETTTIVPNDITKGVSQKTRASRADRCTSLTGSFRSVTNFFKERDYKTVGGAIFEAKDAGTFPKRFDLFVVPKDSTARRLAKLEFNRLRLEREITFPAKMSAWKLQAGDVINFDFPQLQVGLDTTFQVIAKQLFLTISDGTPNFGLDFEVKQLTEEAFAVNDLDDDRIISTAITTTLDPRTVAKPGLPKLTEELFQTTPGSGLRTKVVANWEASSGPFLIGYRFSYKAASATNFTQLPDTPDTTVTILDLAPGAYVFKLTAFNSIGVESEPVETQVVQILGKTRPPADPTGFRLQMLGTELLATWNATTDADVSEGGTFQIWHHANLNGIVEEATLIVENNGSMTLQNIPFMRGNYFLRFVDGSENKSDFVSKNTENLAPIKFAQIVAGGVFDPTDLVAEELSIQESPFWPSTNPNNTVDIDLDEGVIKLPLASAFDDIVDFDAVTDVDGIIGQVAPVAHYFFSSGIVLNQPTKMTLESKVVGIPIDINDSFDDRAGNVDDFIDWDNNIAPGTSDAWNETRFTMGDPEEVDTIWSPWERTYTKNIFAKAVEFATVIRSGASQVATDLIDDQQDFDAIPNVDALGLLISTAPNANFHVQQSGFFVKEVFEAGQVRPATEIPTIITTVPAAIEAIPTPRVGVTSLKEAAFSPSVVRIGHASPDNFVQSFLNAIAAETTIFTIGNNLKFGRWQGSSSPFTGTGAATSMSPNFSQAIAELKRWQPANVVFFRTHNLLWPLFPSAWGTSGTNASNILDRIGAAVKALVKNFGPEAQAGQGDILSGADFDLLNEVVATDSSALLTDCLHNGGPFRLSLGNDWFADAIVKARPLLPASTRICINEFGVEHGFNPRAEADGTLGVFTGSDTGAQLFGYPNIFNEVTAMYRLAEVYLQCMDVPNGAALPDIIGLQGDINATKGAAVTDRRTYLNLAEFKKWCCELTNYGENNGTTRKLVLQITEMRLNHATPSGVDFMTQADADQFEDYIEIVGNNSYCDVISGFSEFNNPTLSVYKSIFDNLGNRRTSVGANNVDIYTPVKDGIARIKPIAIRKRDGVEETFSRLFIHQSGARRPIIYLSGTPVSTRFDQRAGYFPRNATEVWYIDFDDVVKCVPSVKSGNITGVCDFWVPTIADGIASSDEIFIFFATDTGTDGLEFNRDASTGRLQFDCIVSAVSLFSGDVEVNSQALQAGGGSGDFPDGNTGASILQAEADARSTRFAFTIDRDLNQVSCSLNGHTAVTQTASAAIPAYNRVYIASRASHNANERYRGRIRRLELKGTKKTPAELVTLSAAAWGTID